MYSHKIEYAGQTVTFSLVPDDGNLFQSYSVFYSGNSANTIDDAVTPGIFSANDLQFGFVLQYNNDNQFQFVIKLKSGTHNLEFVKCRRRASGVWGDFIVLGQ